MSTDRPLSLGIIGGGASAVLLLAHLAHQNKIKAGKITVYDRSGVFGRGIAYGTKNPAHLLNVRASNMSAFQNKPQHFVNWLAEQDKRWKPESFVPRVVYAEYLKEVLQESKEKLSQAGCKVIFRDQDIKDLKAVKANTIVLATGNAVALHPQGEGYYDSPWNIDYKTLEGDVIIIGIGLSMVDTAVALHSAGHKGKVTAISRRGLLPAVHGNSASFPAFEVPGTILGIFKEIRRQVKNTAQQQVPWQAVIDSLRPVTNKIWLSLPDKEKKKARRLMTYWNIHRHRMAPEISQIIEKMKNTGQLEIIKDEVIHADDRKVTCRKGIYIGDYVINCLGYTRDDNFPYFLENEADGLFALGPALLGVYFETTAIPEIRSQADAIATKILQR